MMLRSANHRIPIVMSSLCVILLLLQSCILSTPAMGKVRGNRRSAVLAQQYSAIMPPISNDVILNPGEGWVLYGSPSNQNTSTLAYASVGYTRYDWASIEPTEGNYNWSIIDNDLNAWAALGKQFAFGVMNADSSDANTPYITPQWVFADGAASVKSNTFDEVTGKKGVQYEPVWDDPVFLQKLGDFLSALAQRYDSNPNIAYIDIRSYGNYGEQHVYGIPPSVALSPLGLQRHIQMYLDAFKHVQLISPWGMAQYNSIYNWATNNGVGIRRDGVIVDSNGSEVTRAYGKAPGVFEFYASYQWLRTNGYWSDAKLRSEVNIGKPSYIDLGQWGDDAQVMLTNSPTLVHDLANLMGYHFVLTNATIPTAFSNNQVTSIGMSWSNQGVAYLYKPAKVAVALLDSANNVVQKQWLNGFDPRLWTPGKTTTQSATFTMSGIPAGTYKLAIGLFQNPTDSNPIYKIGNQGGTANGWYVLSNTVIV